MRTNIEIDDQLLADAQSVSGSSTKKQTVQRALELMVSLGRQAEVKQLRGRLRWEGDLEGDATRRPVIVVDSSVWIDYFNGTDNGASSRLEQVLGTEPILVGDLILTEVLQGFRSDADYRAARTAMAAFPLGPMVGPARAVRAADNYRLLRSRGVTVRKTIDVLIGTFCIDESHQLLFSDRDFEPMVEHLGLQRAWHS